MELRKIVYASMQANSGSTTIYSAAATWGELKAENDDIAAKASGMKAFIREGRIELNHDYTQLPAGDINLYFIVEKNNSGQEHSDVWEVIDQFVKNLN